MQKLKWRSFMNNVIITITIIHAKKGNEKENPNKDCVQFYNTMQPINYEDSSWTTSMKAISIELSYTRLINADYLLGSSIIRGRMYSNYCRRSIAGHPLVIDRHTGLLWRDGWYIVCGTWFVNNRLTPWDSFEINLLDKLKWRSWSPIDFTGALLLILTKEGWSQKEDCGWLINLISIPSRHQINR